MSTTTIANMRGLEILDSRGNPTVEAEVVLVGGARERAAAPSGASTGRREAKEKRDGGKRHNGRGALQAAAHISNDIATALRGKDAADQAAIDGLLLELDGNADKSRLGGNALLAVSLAVAKAAAAAAEMPLFRALGGDAARTLPTPLMNVINGGAHAANNLDIQEFMLVPRGFERFGDALRAGVETFHALRENLQAAGLSTAVGDEGGFAPNVDSTPAALDLLMAAIERAGYRPGEEIAIALDCAAGEIFRDGTYHLATDEFSGDATTLVGLLEEWSRRYPIVSIEDACDEDDKDGWKILTKRLGGRMQLVGDDLFVTNPAILRSGIREGLATALLVKPNQIGTLTETIEAVRTAQEAGYETIVSHRSGDTEHADIADIAVGLRCSQIKTGAPCRGERTAKYNRLARIADMLGDNAAFAVGAFRSLAAGGKA